MLSVALPSIPGESQNATGSGTLRDTTLLNARDIDNPALGPFRQPESIVILLRTHTVSVGCSSALVPSFYPTPLHIRHIIIRQPALRTHLTTIYGY